MRYVGLILLGLVFVGWRIVGYRVNKPVWQTGSQVKIKTQVDEVYLDSQFRQYFYFSGLRIQVPSNLRLNNGDRVEIIGSVKSKLINKNQQIFQLDIKQFMSFPGQNLLKENLDMARNSLIQRFLRWLPGDEGALMAGIVLGGNTGMQSETKQQFVNAGLTHIIAASGYNVSVVAGLMTLLWVKIIGRRWGDIISIAGIVVYVGLAGGGPPVIRAGIMASVVILARLAGRKGASMWLFGWTLIIMLALTPALVESVSFWLSATAMWGVIMAGAINTSKKEIVQQLNAGVWVTLCTFPVMTYVFGTFSWVGPVLTLIVTLLVPIIMQIGLFAMMVGIVSPGFGGLISLAGWPMLRLINWGVSWVDKSWSLVQVHINMWQLAVWYVILVGFYIWRYRKLH